MDDWSARPKPPIVATRVCVSKRWMEPYFEHVATHLEHLPPAIIITSTAKCSTKGQLSSKATPDPSAGVTPLL